MGVPFPIHRPAQAVTVGLDATSAVAATYHALEDPLWPQDASDDSSLLLAGLDPLVEFLSYDGLVLTGIFLVVVLDLAQVESTFQNVPHGVGGKNATVASFEALAVEPIPLAKAISN